MINCQEARNAVTILEAEVGKHGAIIGRMPLDHDLGLAGLTGTELREYTQTA